ncbi:MAG: T9SS type A sorting domain-containing protein, partial [Bacteroidetes bacterium]|nr:T9SS type A sorting domain-containing protein [Bacteroidota bacterium]
TPNVELQWMTATEVNNYGFEVEKKLQDSKIPKFQDWVKVGFVEGAGNSNSPKNYLFTDNNITDGKITYRLKQIDRDGNFTYSHEVEIEAGNIPQRFSLEQNYPNPFNPTTQIRFTIPVSSFTTLKVYDIVGREVAMLVNEVKEAGSYSVQLSMNEYQLSSGVYFYTLRAGNFVATKKMLLMK